jgi:hexosaminidase
MNSAVGWGIVAWAVAGGICSGAAGQSPELPVIPRPAEWRITHPERFMLPAGAAAAEFLHVSLTPALGAQLGPEGYHLDVAATGACLTAATEAGVFYGRQTWAQLGLAPDGRVPSLSITDQPCFRWRGFMLDVARHYAPPAEIKALLDELARYKLNRFHWHLTDDEGWRIEIKKYPLLATIGGSGDKSDPRALAQFYTQAEVRDIVAYARARHITIVPELDMPGHASAATRAYPEHAGGGSDRLPNFTFNPGQAATLQFL